MGRVEDLGAAAAAVVAALLMLGLAAALGAAVGGTRPAAGRRQRATSLCALAGAVGAAIVMTIDAGVARALLFLAAGVGLVMFGRRHRRPDVAPALGALVIGLFVGGAEYGPAVALTALAIGVRWIAEPRRTTP